MKNPVDVLREQGVLSRKMHEETGAPLINVPIPAPRKTIDKEGDDTNR